MSFFSKKPDPTITSAPREDDENAPRIHVMQDDLDTIAREGKVSITDSETHGTPPESVFAPIPEKPSEKTLDTSPFSRPIYPTPPKNVEQIWPAEGKILPQSGNRPFPTATPEALPDSALPLQNTKQPKPFPFQVPPVERGSFSIQKNTPEVPPTLLKPLPSLQPIPESPPTFPFSSPKKEFPEPQQAALRTGAWPVEEIPKDEKKPQEPPHELARLTRGKPFAKKTKKRGVQKKDLSPNIILEEKHWLRRILLTIFLLLLITSLGGGGYYSYQKTRNGESFSDILSKLQKILRIATETPKQEPKLPQQPSETSVKPPEALPFTVDRPNTFSLDVETETISTIQEKLLSNAKIMQDARMTGPVPFSVVDKTNTPIAFFVFASISNLGLSGDLLNSLGDTFLLYLSIDNTFPRLSLAVDLKDPEGTRKYLSLAERNLPTSLKNLLLSKNYSLPATHFFEDSTYRGMPVRFMNFSSSEPLSIDYTLTREFLVIATSKDTGRAVLDMVLEKERDGQE